MNKPRQKIIFIGTSSFALPALEKLIEDNYVILAVVTAPDKPAGRKQELTMSPIKEMSSKYGLNILQPEDILDIRKEIKELKADLIVTASYGQILPENILNIPKKRSINLHPSLLPKYRGPSPIQTTILNGDEKTGVSIIQMDEKMDHGPIIAQQESEINPDDTYQSLEIRLAEQSADLLIEILPRYFKNKLEIKEQDENQSTYTKILTRDDGKIDWQKSAIEIERQIRGLYPWPGTWTELNGQRIKIIKAKAVDQESETTVKTRNGYLSLESVQPAGKKSMTGEEFLRGYEFKV